MLSWSIQEMIHHRDFIFHERTFPKVQRLSYTWEDICGSFSPSHLPPVNLICHSSGTLQCSLLSSVWSIRTLRSQISSLNLPDFIVYCIFRTFITLNMAAALGLQKHLCFYFSLLHFVYFTSFNEDWDPDWFNFRMISRIFFLGMSRKK